MAQIGDVAPDFSGKDVMTGSTFKLSDHYGKVIVLAFVGYL